MHQPERYRVPEVRAAYKKAAFFVSKIADLNFSEPYQFTLLSQQIVSPKASWPS